MKVAMGYLGEYKPSKRSSFVIYAGKNDTEFDCEAYSFTPCAEPVELDPITLEPKDE